MNILPAVEGSNWPVDSICGFVAATNIEDIFQVWSCTANGSATSDPCTWNGTSCTLDEIASISFMGSGDLTGTLSPIIGSITTLSRFEISQTGISGNLPAAWSTLGKLNTLYLYESNLVGTLPSAWGSLTGLESLNIGATSVVGVLPSSWGSLTGLTYLSLSGNSLTGTLPSTWGLLSSILELLLESNSLTGSLPPSWGSLGTLELLYLNSNSFTGTLPAAWGSLTSVFLIEFSFNYLTGHLPNQWDTLHNAYSIEMGGNFLSGSLPSSWGLLPQVKYMYLDSNSFTGSLPAEWCSLVHVMDLYLFENSLTGTLPSTWGSLVSLEKLELSSNSFSGSFPSTWGSLGRLDSLFINFNSLTGPLPDSFGSLTRLTLFYIFSNSLSGSLPSTWSSLTAMKLLFMDTNSLTGSLPSSWVSMSVLVNLHLYSNSLTGTLPSMWGSLTLLQALELHSNSLVGTLPSSWGSLSGLLHLDLNSNSLTGSLPPSWGSLGTLELLYLDSNSFTGTLPTSFRLLTGLQSLFLSANLFSGSLEVSLLETLVHLRSLEVNGNYLTGSLPSNWESLQSLQYVDLFDNLFTGSFPQSWGSNSLIRIDASNNLLTGNLSTAPAGYPGSLASLNVAFNRLSGSIPAVLAFSGNLSTLNVSSNDIVGTIPAEFSLSAGVSIDVSNTDIDCYSGCLTSTKVIVQGASPECHDGSIMLRFVIICAVCGSVAVVGTVLYRWHGRWAAWLGVGIAGSTPSASAADNVEITSKATGSSNTLFTMTLIKLCFGILISLTLSNWWTYSGGAAVTRNSDVITSCSNPTVGHCYSFCGDVHVVTVDIVDDDLSLDDDKYGSTEEHQVEHIKTGSYCVATLSGSCGYEFWLDFKLVPILLHALGLVLQVLLWRYGHGDFPGEPQTAHYDLLREHLCPGVINVDTDLQDVLSYRSGEHKYRNRLLIDDSWVSLLRRLVTPLYPSIFWFLELVTAMYVWGEVVFPPVYCGSAPPLSLYYYPILMSLLDLMKLNIYSSRLLWKEGRRVEAILAMLDLKLLVTNMWVTVVLGLLFIWGLLRDCCQCLFCAIGRAEHLEWSEHAGVQEPTLNPLSEGVDKNSKRNSGKGDLELAVQ